MTYAAAGLLVAAAAQGVLLVWLARRAGAIVQLEQRVTRLADALALLTDTAESGFRTMAERIPAAPPSRPRAPRQARQDTARRTAATPKVVAHAARRTTAAPTPGAHATRRTKTVTTRVAQAARRGRSVQEIAAAEQVSEGEIRLRMHVAGASAAAAPAQ